MNQALHSNEDKTLVRKNHLIIIRIRVTCVNVTACIFLTSKGSIMLESTRILINRPGMTQILCWGPSPVMRVVSANQDQTAVFTVEQSAASRTKEAPLREQPLHADAFFDIHMCAL